MEKNNKDELDTETTIVDMNVEGMPWYDKSLKDGKPVEKISKEEQKIITKAMILAYLPFACMVAAVFGILFFIAWVWLH